VNSKVTLYLFCLVLFLFLGFEHILAGDKKGYVSKFRDEAKFITFTVGSLKCKEKNKTSNVIEIVAKENNASIYGNFGNKIDCPELEKLLGDGKKVEAHVLPSQSQLMSLKVDGVWVFDFEEFLNDKRENYGNYSAIYFVLSLVFFFLFLNERKKITGTK